MPDFRWVFCHANFRSRPSTVTKPLSKSVALRVRGNAQVNPAPTRSTMLIGELATLGGASVQAIRLYERRGLMCKPERTASGYRVYQSIDLEILKAIKRCQSLGMTLGETKRVTRILERTRRSDGSLSSGQDRLCLEEIEQIGLQKLTLLDSRIRALSATKDELRRTLRQIRTAIAGAV
jgi:MerR family mercuric resistance operon transcriptional regulator